MSCTYNLPELPAGVILRTDENSGDESVVKWSGVYPIPEIGRAVRVKVNSLGTGVVEAYFVEHGFCGVQVKLDDAPEWHRKQNAGKWHAGKALVFGKEIELLPADGVAAPEPSGLVLPIVHRNGTSRDELVEQRTDAAFACDAVLESLDKMSPNQRDYYTGPPELFKAAVAQHERRRRMVRELMASLQAEAEALSAE